MSSFRVDTESRRGGVVYRLFDDATGASASVLPSVGFNLFDLRLPVAGEVRPVLWAEPDWADTPRSHGRNGTPILFPFPNRIAHGHYTFGDKDFQLPTRNGEHAIHGFAIATPWDVIEHRAHDSGATLTGQFRISTHAPDKRGFWPTDAILQVGYTLAGRTLIMDVTVTNPTAEPLPYGFGIHPYFRMPFVTGADLAQTRVLLPASEYWPLESYIPTGERRPVTDNGGRLDFRHGQPMQGLKLDDVLTGLEGSPRLCRLVDHNLHNAEFRLGFSPEFRELVVFTPPSPDGVIALEPYTQTTDAINLAARGIDGGLRILTHDHPSDSLQITMSTTG
jgi:aldose 1-epimerase